MNGTAANRVECNPLSRQLCGRSKDDTAVHLIGKPDCPVENLHTTKTATHHSKQAIDTQ